MCDLEALKKIIKISKGYKNTQSPVPVIYAPIVYFCYASQRGHFFSNLRKLFIFSSLTNKNMIYEVQARFIEGKEKEFHQLLNSETLKNQSPDGSEIIASMHRATLDSSGLVRWTEMCFCPSPLYHERSTVLDKFFTDLETKPIEKHEKFEGKSVVEHISKF